MSGLPFYFEDGSGMCLCNVGKHVQTTQISRLLLFDQKHAKGI